MRTISGLFNTYAQATSAIHSLREAGINSVDISLVANSPDALTPDADIIGKDTVAGAEVGALLGGTGGLLAGLGVFAVPGIGPILAGGWLVATAIGALAGAGVGAATGGLVGVLADAGIPKADAQVYAEGVRQGGALLSARVVESQVPLTTELLAQAGAVDLEARRQQLERAGWDPLDTPANGDLAEPDRLTYPGSSPPI